MPLFLLTVLSIWAAMHAFVFWRLGTVSWISDYVSNRALFLSAAALWAFFPFMRLAGARLLGPAAFIFEFAASLWFGVLFLLFCALLAVDVLTLGGWLLPKLAIVLRGWAVIAAVVLSAIALVQGLRAPVLREYEVTLKDLPAERDGLTLVAISDLHLGNVIGERWLARLVNRIDAMHPDFIAVVGDLVDSDTRPVQAMLPTLRRLSAPLGVYAVAGNHEFYAGFTESARILTGAGFKVLHDESIAIVPGLVLTGVDDLSVRRHEAQPAAFVTYPLSTRPPGASILLSHSPLGVEAAAQAGAGLMISGHTHGGQIWPFNYLVETQYPRIGGRYDVAGMTLIVCRGTGTWGPRMRLWRPAEIVRIRLRSPAR